MRLEGIHAEDTVVYSTDIAGIPGFADVHAVACKLIVLVT
jgi:hypothetical protein